MPYCPMLDILQGRVILVTGGAGGLGRAVALACARHGATVVIADGAETELAKTYDLIEDQGGPEPVLLELDLGRADPVLFAAVADRLAAEWGRLDGLVHCAAFAPYLSRIDDYECADWERVLCVNLTVPFLLTQACLPLLRAAPDGSIVFTADRVGRRGLAYWGAYAAAKFGIEGLMQVLAEETCASTRLRVNSLDPGIVRTTLRQTLYPGENPFHHPEPAEVASSYLYLLGPDARGVTGRALVAPCGPD